MEWLPRYLFEGLYDVAGDLKGGAEGYNEDNIRTKDFPDDLPRICDSVLALETLLIDSNQGKMVMTTQN